MTSPPVITSPAKQKGLVLLILVITIALVFISYMMSELSRTEIRVQQEEKTQAALNKAKQALLAYAMNYPDTRPPPPPPITQGPGNFPCPDSSADLDGNSNPVGGLNPACNSPGPGVLDRFPWQTLETGELRDGSGELLWYAVSRNFAAAGPAIQLNTSTPGQILIRNKDGTVQFSGANPLQAIVAVIIAPGETIVRSDGLVQSRATPAEQADARNYLDIAYDGIVGLEEDNADFTNASATDGFIPGPVRDAANNIIVNDQFVTITYEEVMELVHARVASEVIDVLNAYKASPCAVFPEASLFDNATFNPTTNNYNTDIGEQSGHIPDFIDLVNNWNTGCAIGIELPTWLDAENWHENIFYQFITMPCTPGPPPLGDCIVINNTTPLIDNAEAIIMFAGRVLPVQDRANVPVQKSDYYENENNNSDTVFDINEAEDFIWVVAP